MLAARRDGQALGRASSLKERELLLGLRLVPVLRKKQAKLGAVLSVQLVALRGIRAARQKRSRRTTWCQSGSLRLEQRAGLP